MKTPADIEKLTLAELEKMADDTSVAVPEKLEQKVTDAVLAAEVLGETAQRNPEEGGRRMAGFDLAFQSPESRANYGAAMERCPLLAIIKAADGLAAHILEAL